MPTLASRIEDLPALIDAFIAQSAGRGRPRLRLMAETTEVLANYPWPGNIRELSNLIERLAILCPERPVGIGDLPARYRPVDWTPPVAETAAAAELPALLASMVSEDSYEGPVLPAEVWNCEQESPTKLPEEPTSTSLPSTLR